MTNSQLLLKLFVCGALVTVSLSTLNAVAKSALQIVAGDSHTCAIESNGDNVICWGHNNIGQLGTIDVGFSSQPLTIPQLPARIVSIDTGGSGTVCVVLRDATVYCWGSGQYGQLGNGYIPYMHTPTHVARLTSGARLVAVGAHHVCALMQSGEVSCWGNNLSGQAGRPAQHEEIALPHTVAGLDASSTAISVGAHHSCAIDINKRVQCWGSNKFGQLGTGDTIDSHSPRTVVGVDAGVVQLVSGDYFSCALLTDRSVKCWGDNQTGALGTGVAVGGGSFSSWPIAVNDLANSAALYRGQDYTCARSTSGVLRCWGYNLFKQISDTPGLFYAATPVEIAESDRQGTQVALGSTHLCELRDRGVVRCWGYNNSGNLGDGTYVPSKRAVTVLGTNIGTMIEFVSPSLLYYFSTSRPAEIALLDSLATWSRTGTSFSVLADEEGGSTALSRYYFDKIALNGMRGSHFYTALQSEKDVLHDMNPTNAQVEKLPFNEGIDSFVFPPVRAATGDSFSCSIDRVPIYRLFRGPSVFPDNANHRFTPSIDDYTQLVANGWDAEGIKFCVPR